MFQTTDASLDAPCLSVCLRCKPAEWRGPDDRRPGAELALAVLSILASSGRRGADFREIRCLSQCKRPCVVAFSGHGRFTYLFGDLDPARDVAAVAEAFDLYRAASDGFLERRDRPEALRAGILGRLPPLNSTHPIVQASRGV